MAGRPGRRPAGRGLLGCARRRGGEPAALARRASRIGSRRGQAAPPCHASISPGGPGTVAAAHQPGRRSPARAVDRLCRGNAGAS